MISAAIRAYDSYIFALTNMFARTKVDTYSLKRMHGGTDEDRDWQTAGRFSKGGCENHQEHLDRSWTKWPLLRDSSSVEDSETGSASDSRDLQLLGREALMALWHFQVIPTAGCREYSLPHPQWTCCGSTLQRQGDRLPDQGRFSWRSAD